MRWFDLVDLLQALQAECWRTVLVSSRTWHVLVCNTVTHSSAHLQCETSPCQPKETSNYNVADIHKPSRPELCGRNYPRDLSDFLTAPDIR